MYQPDNDKSKLLENAQSENIEFMYHNIVKRYQAACFILLENLEIHLTDELGFWSNNEVQQFLKGKKTKEIANDIINVKIQRWNVVKIYGESLAAEIEAHYKQAITRTVTRPYDITEVIMTLKTMNADAKAFAKMHDLPQSFIDYIDQKFQSDAKKILTDLSISIFNTPKQMIIDIREALEEVRPGRVSTLRSIEVKMTHADLQAGNWKAIGILKKIDGFIARSHVDLMDNLLIKISVPDDMLWEDNAPINYEWNVLHQLKRWWTLQSKYEPVDALELLITRLMPKNIIVVNPSNPDLMERYLQRIENLSPINTNEIAFLNLNREETAYKLVFDDYNEYVGVAPALAPPGSQASSHQPITANTASEFFVAQAYFWRVVCHCVAKLLPSNHVRETTESEIEDLRAILHNFWAMSGTMRELEPLNRVDPEYFNEHLNALKCKMHCLSEDIIKAIKTEKITDNIINNFKSENQNIQYKLKMIALKIKEGASLLNPDNHIMKYDWREEKFVAVNEPEVPVFDLHQIGQYSSTTLPAYTSYLPSNSARNNEQPRHNTNSSICYLKHN